MTPSPGAAQRAGAHEPSGTGERGAPHPGMVWIPGGTFQMGSDDHYPEEAPTHQVSVDGFWMDRHAVTNAEFARFVKETRYVTSPSARRTRPTTPGPPRSCWSPRPWCSNSRHVGSRWTTPTTGGPTCRGRLAPTAGTRQLGEADAGPSRGPGRLGGRRRPTPSGRARICRPRPSGSTPRAEASTGPPTPGATSSRPAAGGWRTPGRASSRSTTPVRTVTPAPHPSARTRPTATACST